MKSHSPPAPAAEIPAANARLRTAIDNAKAVSMPKDNIDRAIKKGTGELGGDAIQEVAYEGYGPAGIAFIIEMATDNLNRVRRRHPLDFHEKRRQRRHPGQRFLSVRPQGRDPHPRRRHR